MTVERVRRFLVATAALASVGTVLLLALSLIPAWPFVLIEHFRVQIVVGAIATAIAAAALRVRGYFDVAVMMVCVHALWIVPDLSRARRPAPVEGHRVRVLLLNVHTSSSTFDAVRALITDVNPDIVGLVEMDQRWIDGIAPAVIGYQRLEKPRNDNFGVALYSKYPLAGRVEELRGLPTVFAELTLPRTRLHVVLTHPLPPVSAVALADQVAVFDALAARLSEPILVMGDFNATPWSRPFLQFVRDTALCDSRAGFGLQGSFPADSWVLRIPIDHVLMSCSMGVIERRIERDVGSDHLPVVVEIVVP